MVRGEVAGPAFWCRVFTTFAFALCAASAYAGDAEKPNRIERTANRAAQGTENTAKRAGKFVEKTATRSGKFVEKTGKRAANFVDRTATKTGNAVKRALE
jgi:hypothetical protein